MKTQIFGSTSEKINPDQPELFDEGVEMGKPEPLPEVLAQPDHYRKTRQRDHFTKYFSINNEISIRDRDGVLKTFSGLMKIIYPHEEATKEEVQELLAFCLEGRKRVKDHIIRIDSTFYPVDFSFTDLETNETHIVKSLEEIQHPSFATQADEEEEQKEEVEEAITAKENPSSEAKAPAKQPESESGKNYVIPENTKGVDFKVLFGPYLKGATEITVYDPYIRHFYQRKNMMEFLEMVHYITRDGDQVEVKLITKTDEAHCVDQDEDLRKMEETFSGSKVIFSFEYDNKESFHARSVNTNTGWKITLDRGLDIYQRHDMTPFSLAGKIPKERLCREFEVTYLKD